MKQKESIKILQLQGEKIIPYLDDLAKLRIAVFKEYPYLYEGDSAAEANFIKKYINCAHAILFVVLHDNKVVGVATGLPLEFEFDAIKQPFIDNNLIIKNIYYLGDQILLPEYRGQGIGKKFFTGMEAGIKNFNQYSCIAFCAIERDISHPKKPKNYQSLDEYYKKHGYKKHPELVAKIPWAEIGSAEKINHTLVFWLKNI
jgi:GNAT superfamily N-acetyltransferase